VSCVNHTIMSTIFMPEFSVVQYLTLNKSADMLPPSSPALATS